LNGRRDPYGSSTYGTAYGGYAPYGTDTDAAARSTAGAPQEITGLLRLAGTPGEAQVFVDSYFVGTLADLEAGRPLTVDAGPHRLDVRAPGYQPTTVDVRIAPHDTITYRAALDRILPPPPMRVAAAASTMYVIPNCYLGNVPPRPSRLAAGCDIKQVQVLGAK
jgi:hypothetical protein